MLFTTCKHLLYKAYKKMQHLPLAATAVHFVYGTVLPYCRRSTRPCRLTAREPIPPAAQDRPGSLSQLRIAIICDEMTYQGFDELCSLRFVTPHNWLQVFREFRPHLFFCESAWLGIRQYPGAWRGKIYRNHKVLFENRRSLLKILEYCRRAGIPSVFWNKEDPAFYGNPEYDFVDTALRFDRLFTTAEECVPRYRALGHQQVEVLQFGFSPRLYHPAGNAARSNTAVFAGSWYADQPQRCRDMERIFDMVLEHGIALEIYDRQYYSSNPLHQYPARYRPYLHPAVNYRQLGEIYRGARYAVNVNSVTDSRTMFARRVFELMASNVFIISNPSLGMQELFGDHVWLIDRPKPEGVAEKCRENVEYVLQYHTNRRRLEQVAQAVGFSLAAVPPRIAVIALEGAQPPADTGIAAYVYAQGLLTSPGGEPFPLEEWASREKSPYCILLGPGETLPELPRMLRHLSYLPGRCGIREGGPPYSFTEDAKNTRTLFPSEQLPLYLLGERTRKYQI